MFDLGVLAGGIGGLAMGGGTTIATAGLSILSLSRLMSSKAGVSLLTKAAKLPAKGPAIKRIADDFIRVNNALFSRLADGKPEPEPQ